MKEDFDLIDLPDNVPDPVKNFADGLKKSGNMTAQQIGTRIQQEKDKLFARSDWAEHDDPMATLQEHVDAMGVQGVVLFAAGAVQSRVAWLLKNIPKNDPGAAIQMLEGMKAAMDPYLETLDANFKEDPVVKSPVNYEVDQSGPAPRIVFDTNETYPGPKNEE